MLQFSNYNQNLESSTKPEHGPLEEEIPSGNACFQAQHQISGVSCLQKDQDIFRHKRFRVLQAEFLLVSPALLPLDLFLPFFFSLSSFSYSLLLLLLPCVSSSLLFFLPWLSLCCVLSHCCDFPLTQWNPPARVVPGQWQQLLWLPPLVQLHLRNDCWIRRNGHLVRASETKSGDAEPGFNRKL